MLDQAHKHYDAFALGFIAEGMRLGIQDPQEMAHMLKAASENYIPLVDNRGRLGMFGKAGLLDADIDTVSSQIAILARHELLKQGHSHY
jgi:hypothetical protein